MDSCLLNVSGFLKSFAFSLSRFLQEMSAAGLPSVRAHVYEDVRIGLTSNTTSFALSYLHLVDSLLKLFNSSLRSVP